MALPTAAPRPHNPEVVGKAFVEQYYKVLCSSPDQVYKFYHESSFVSRQDSNGVSTSVTTIKAINDLVLSMDYNNHIAEIMTADSQQSYMEGVFVLVTGLIGHDKIRRRFSQSFFLAPQDADGYFVLNDVFRFVDEIQPREVNQVLVNDTHDAPSDPLTPELVQDLNATESSSLHSLNLAPDEEEACNLPENGGSIAEDVIVESPVHQSDIDPKPVSEIATPVVQEDVPKKSYASIVKRANGSAPWPVYVPTPKARPATVSLEKQPVASFKPAPTSELPATTNGTSEKKVTHEEEGHSIYLRNLPMSATAPQIEEEFKKFGPIKPGGVQVRSHKLDKFCFGFVEFESLDAMHAAIEASPMVIGGHNVHIEEKRTTTRVINGIVSTGNGAGGRGRYLVGRGGGVRNDNFRGGRGSFNNSQGGSFVRNDFRNRGNGEYSSRGRGVQGRTGDGPQLRTFQKGYDRMARPNLTNQTATVAA